jgi:hypothetical protein
MAEIVQSLFGVSPEMYEQQQEDRASARAMQFAKLDPFQQANYAIGRGAYGLAGALGGALGGQDPELQRRTVSQQILGMIDPNRPETFDQAVQMALQSGDQRLAYGLRIEAEKFKQQALVRSDEAQIRADRLLARQQEAQAQRIAQGAYQPGTPEQEQYVQVDETGQPVPIPARPASFDISRVASELMRTAAGREQLKNLAAAQKLTMPEVKEVPKGAKLLERTPTGWRTVSVTGQPEIQATSDNAIQTLIASGAVHPTIVPYAQQIARRFATLDPEDQDKAMQTFTQLNNQATNQEATRTASASAAAGAASSRELSRELVRLSIADATRKAAAAADGKPLGINDSTKLAERSASADKLVNIYESFKPEFSGFATDQVGDVAVVIAGKSKDAKSVELFQWWQGYQENINKVRNELFGAALTVPEKAEFEKAMVTKGMSPEQASKNLKRQAELSINAYNKLEKVLRVQGFSKAGLDALKPTGIRPGLENFVVPSVPAPAAR